MTYQESYITPLETAAAATRHPEHGRPPQSERVLLVGPLPPPMTGTHVTFDIVCREAAAHLPADQLCVVDTSQKRLKKHTRIASFRNLRQAARILQRYRKALRDCQRVLIFGSNGFLLSMAPILVWLAKRAGKPVGLRAFGGSLDRFQAGLNPLARRLLSWTLRQVDAVSVQTKLLQDALAAQVGDRVHQASGFRYLLADSSETQAGVTSPDGALRLLFVGLVRADKGVLVLLESLQRLARAGVEVQCDLYGPLWPAFADEFSQAIRRVANAEYKGVLEPAKVVETMAKYEALVFPTYYQGEGHPGVLIESMMAGIPVITTAFRAIPELISQGENGWLVPPQDTGSLAEAIRGAAADREALAAMAANNWLRREQFDARRLVPALLEQLGVPLSHA